MKGFNFEKNLHHQSHAVESTVAVFEGITCIQPTGAEKHCINPVLDYDSGLTYRRNLRSLMENNGVKESVKGNSTILDIMMETGTGKTYTYTKTMFELNKHYGVFKFIVVVPTLSIKAGTVDFLQSASSREHFKEQYGKTLHLHIVESQRGGRNKKSYIPPAVISFVNAGNYEKNSIQVLIINAGMINSDTMKKSFDKGLFDKYTVPFEALAATKPFVIIDEPHKFGTGNTTWENIKSMKPQFFLRYGATFQGYENLIYTLTAVDAFNRNLVKGVIGHIIDFKAGQNAAVRFVDSDGTEASFELIENDRRTAASINKKESLQKIHSAMGDITVENLNKSTVVLSNGLELKKGDKINPYSYATTLQDLMIQTAVEHHFKLEKQLLTRSVKIKPLTLFFIDNIDEYRNKNGSIRKTIEQCIAVEIKKLLKTEEDVFYKSYLEKTLLNLSATHGGYFSKDNTEKDEAIEKEITYILHDMLSLLYIQNPLLFIFSKCTLREGWDNPNVFQICKIRSSGSDISKLQEVGRGLRLPVNEYGNRVKDEPFFLNYFVDFTETDFVDTLVNEINKKSGAISIEVIPEKLTDDMIQQIMLKYNLAEVDLLEQLDAAGVIKRNNDFKAGGFDYIKSNFALIFEGVNSNKIRKATDTKKKITVRTSKYDELKELWEKLNERVILEYKFENELVFQKLLKDFFQVHKDDLATDNINEKIARVEISGNQAVAVREPESVFGRATATIATMKYSDFLKELSKILNINLKTLHQSILESGIEINQYRNQTSLRIIKQNFDHFLMANAIDKFSIEYKRVSNTIHPTKLTDAHGAVVSELNASDIGILFSEEHVAETYFFDELYYDSDLEKANIRTEISEVVVFTKIPKNSIKIPVAGGKSYSPDFAYVLKFKDGEQKLSFIVETKDVSSQDGLRGEEKFKIKHAEQFFKGNIKIAFKTQFSNKSIANLINEIVSV